MRGDIDFDQIWPRRRRPRVVRTGSRRPRRRTIIVWAIVLLLLLLIGGGDWLLQMRVNYLFLASLGHSNVFWTPVVSQVVLFVIGLLVGGGLMALNKPLWNRIGRALDERAPGYVRWVGWAVVVLIGLACGSFLASQWQTVLLWLHGKSFGVTDPVFGMDVSFFIFTLPFLDILMAIGFGLVIVSLLIAAGLLVLSVAAIEAPPGEIPLKPSQGHTLEEARALSLRLVGVLVALFLLLSAAGAHLTVFHLVTNQNSTYNFYGLGATDLNVQRPVLGALQWIALVAAVVILLLVFVRGRRGALRLGVPMGIVSAVWLLLNIVLQTVPGAIYENAVVNPNALAAETTPINNYLQMSRNAWGLNPGTNVVTPKTGFQNVQPATLADLEADQQTLSNIRIQDYRELPDTLAQIDRSRNYQTYPTITVDRYAMPNGTKQEVMLAPREIDSSQVTSGFVPQNEVYTHGYGITAVSISQTGDSGKPEILVGGQPMHAEVSTAPPSLSFNGQTVPGIGGVGDPRIYCGLDTTQPVVVNTTQQEFDYPAQNGDHTSQAGYVQGIKVTNPIDKLALSLNVFGGTNFFLTNTLTPQSQVLINRTIQQRISTIAPFLTLDSDPYVVVDPQTNHLMYIADAYVESGNYPDSFQINGVDYMRNSVKAVVDAKTCQTTLYMVNPSEPITAAYNAIYPGLMQPLSSMPSYLKAHLRYPEDLFQNQSQVFAQVHVPNASVFFNGSDRWRPSQENVNGQVQNTQAYYVELTLPGRSNDSFVLMQTFSPATGGSGGGASSANNMTAWLAAECNYTSGTPPKLVSIPLNNSQNVLGPLQFDNNINTNTQISQQITLLSQSGSQVVLGNVIVLPFNDHTFLYVRPLYVEATGNTGSNFPELQDVIVGNQNGVAMGANLQAALQSLFNTTQPIAGVPGTPISTGGQPPTTTPPTTAPGSEQVPAGTVALINDLLNHEQQAEAALRAGDFAKFGQEEAVVQSDAQKLRQLLGQTSSTSPSPSPTPSASASASPSP